MVTLLSLCHFILRKKQNKIQRYYCLIWSKYNIRFREHPTLLYHWNLEFMSSQILQKIGCIWTKAHWVHILTSYKQNVVLSRESLRYSIIIFLDSGLFFVHLLRNSIMYESGDTADVSSSWSIGGINQRRHKTYRYNLLVVHWSTLYFSVWDNNNKLTCKSPYLYIMLYK